MNPTTVSDPGASLASGSDALAGLAMLGKTAAALAFVIAVILLCSYLLKRLNRPGGLAGQQVQVVSSVAVGPKERVVVVEVAGIWLVLGVAGGQISALHQLPSPSVQPGAAAEYVGPRPASESAGPEPSTAAGGFASRFVQALNKGNGDGPGARGSDS